MPRECWSPERGGRRGVCGVRNQVVKCRALSVGLFVRPGAERGIEHARHRDFAADDLSRADDEECVAPSEHAAAFEIHVRQSRVENGKTRRSRKGGRKRRAARGTPWERRAEPAPKRGELGGLAVVLYSARQRRAIGTTSPPGRLGLHGMMRSPDCTALERQWAVLEGCVGEAEREQRRGGYVGIALVDVARGPPVAAIHGCAWWRRRSRRCFTSTKAVGGAPLRTEPCSKAPCPNEPAQHRIELCEHVIGRRVLGMAERKTSAPRSPARSRAGWSCT
jgi:hypothetical protein